MTKKVTVGLLFLMVNVLSVYAGDYGQKKAIVIGGTSGIGEALVKELSGRGYIVGFVGRRENLLKDIQRDCPNETHICTMDVTEFDAQKELKDLINTMGGVDIFIYNSGVCNFSLDWKSQEEMIDVNVKGFVSQVSCVTDYFLEHGGGHIVGISSIAALKGLPVAPAYSASKAYMSNYLQGLRERFAHLNSNIQVTTIEPGLVDTAMGNKATFWKASPEEVALQICDTIENGDKHAYVTKRWGLIAAMFKLMPDCCFYKLFWNDSEMDALLEK